MGIQPDVIVCRRSDHEVPSDLTAKVALFCDVEQRAAVHSHAHGRLDLPCAAGSGGCAGLGDFVVERMQLTTGSG